MEKKEFKSLIVCILLLITIGVFSAILPLIVIFVPIIISILYNKFKKIFATIGYLLFACCVFLFSNVSIALLLIMLTLPVSICVSFMLQQKKRMYTSVLACITVIFLSIIAYLAYISLSNGVEFTQVIINEIENILLSNNSFTEFTYLYMMDSTAALDYLSTGIMPFQYINVDPASMQTYILDISTQIINTTMPNIIIDYSMIVGFFTFYIAHQYLKKTKATVVKAVSFERLTIPKRETYFLLIAAILTFFIGNGGVEFLLNVSNILLFVFVIVYSIQGYSVIYFYYKEKMYSKLIFILFVIICLVFGVALWVGMLDNIFKLRQRFILSKAQGRDQK